MIDGDLQYFLDKLFLGEELEFTFRGDTFFVQGWSKDWDGSPRSTGDGWCMRLDRFVDPIETVWQTHRQTMSECATEFLRARLWDGHTFNEAEAEMEWVA